MKRSARPGFRAALLVLGGLLPGPLAAGQEPGPGRPTAEDLPRLIQELDRGAGSEDALAGLGAAAVPALLAGLAEAAPPARLRRVRLLAGLASAAETPMLAGLLEGERDPRVRLVLVHALGRRDVPGWRDVIEGRVAALARALSDPARPVAAVALERLVAMDEELAAAALAEAVRRRSFPLRREALVGLAGMESAWRVLPGLLDLVREELPDLLPTLLPGLGTRYREEAVGPILEFLGSREPNLRSAAYQALAGMDAWLFARHDHGRRLELNARAARSWPGRLDLAWGAATVVVLDDRKLADPAEACRRLEPLIPVPEQSERAPEAQARLLLLQGVDRLLAGAPAAAADRFARSWHAVQAARARGPEVPAGDTTLHVETWLDWRRQVDPPLEPEQVKLFERRAEASGGPLKEAQRHLLRLGASVALTAAVGACLDGRESDAGTWCRAAREMLRELESDWDRDLQGPFREHDAVLQGELGALAILQRGLARGAGRWQEAERGFRRLIQLLHGERPDFYPSVEESGGPPDPARFGEQEEVLSMVGLDFAAFLEEAGERDKALAVCRALADRLASAGLSENRELRMRVLFRLAGIYNDMRRPDDSEPLLRDYLRHYQARKAEIEQNPELFRDPAAALRWVDGMLSRAHVSLAVLANVLRKDLEQARYHCQRAFELDGTDFNRILFACYLARAGEPDRARRLAEAVDESPELYYNLACTWALVGEKSRALDLLERDFSVNHLTPRARNLHREWAVRDRDLEPLAGEERFRLLMRREEG